MAKKHKKFADDGWAIWIDGDDTSTIYINDWLNPKGKSYVDMAIRIRKIKTSKFLQVYVPFSISADGIISVSAKDKGTGKEQSIKIEGSTKLSDEEIQRMRADAEAHEAEDKKRLDEQMKLNQAESLINETTKNLNDMADKLTDEEKSAINEKLESLKAVYNVEEKEGMAMKENLLIDKSIAFASRIIKLHQYLIKTKKEKK